MSGWNPGDRAVLCIDGWAGRREVPVTVAGRTPARVRVTLEADAPLPGGREGKAGDVLMVPILSLRWLNPLTDPSPPAPDCHPREGGGLPDAAGE